MKVSIILSDDLGRVFKGEANLAPETEQGAAGLGTVAVASIPQSPGMPNLGFDTPVRAFVKKRAAGKTGAEKFALLLARLTKADFSTLVSGADIQSEWNSMTVLMGGKYNTAYPTRAKEQGWVDSPKSGFFQLRPEWIEIMRQDVAK